jgi:peptidoglycan hydrolase-like protein with peptidoglycan-binding domain
MTMMPRILLTVFLMFAFTGCDRIYGLIHKPGGEEREILGAFVFNEYSEKVEALQGLLKAFGYPLNKPDGRFGATTREAVAKFQADEGLEVTRFVDKATWARMRQYADVFLTAKNEVNGRALQAALKKAGFLSGKIDGQIGPKTREALKAFQGAQGLAADGRMGLRTMKGLLPYLAVTPASASADGTVAKP